VEFDGVRTVQPVDDLHLVDHLVHHVLVHALDGHVLDALLLATFEYLQAIQ
jgi:hypothetical protein